MIINWSQCFIHPGWRVQGSQSRPIETRKLRDPSQNEDDQQHLGAPSHGGVPSNGSRLMTWKLGHSEGRVSKKIDMSGHTTLKHFEAELLLTHLSLHKNYRIMNGIFHQPDCVFLHRQELRLEHVNTVGRTNHLMCVMNSVGWQVRRFQLRDTK